MITHHSTVITPIQNAGATIERSPQARYACSGSALNGGTRPNVRLKADVLASPSRNTISGAHSTATAAATMPRLWVGACAPTTRPCRVVDSVPASCSSVCSASASSAAD